MPRHLPVAALLTAGAGAAHLAAAVPHLADIPLYGLLFVAGGWTQIILAGLLLLSARRAAAWTAIAVNVGAVMAWAVSRTVGLPLAHPEPVLLADALTVGLEVTAAGVLLARLRGLTSGFHAGQVTAVPLLAALVVATGASTVAIADLASDDHHGGEAEQDEGHQDGHGDEPGAVHQHSDDSVHVHQDGRPHVHPDDTVHVHPVGDTGSGVGQNRDGGGDGHEHDHGDDEH